MMRNLYVQAFNFLGGERFIFDSHPGDFGVYFMTEENLVKYHAGRTDFSAEMIDPLSKELLAGHPGRCYLVSGRRLDGGYTVRRGVSDRRGVLDMKRFNMGQETAR